MHACCLEPNKNITLTGDNIFLPSETGNITITYDVTQAYGSSYQAQVRLASSYIVSLRKTIFQWKNI